jgi:hypothetical protein
MTLGTVPLRDLHCALFCRPLKWPGESRDATEGARQDIGDAVNRTAEAAALRRRPDGVSSGLCDTIRTP